MNRRTKEHDKLNTQNMVKQSKITETIRLIYDMMEKIENGKKKNKFSESINNIELSLKECLDKLHVEFDESMKEHCQNFYKYRPSFDEWCAIAEYRRRKDKRLKRKHPIYYIFKMWCMDGESI